MTRVITRAVIDEAVNNNVKPQLEDDLKNLNERVYTDINVNDYLNAVVRDYEAKYATRLNTDQITNADLKEIFEKRLEFIYVLELRYEIVQNYALV